MLPVFLPEILQVFRQLLVLERGLSRMVLLLQSPYFLVEPGHFDSLDFELFSQCERSLFVAVLLLVLFREKLVQLVQLVFKPRDFYALNVVLVVLEVLLVIYGHVKMLTLAQRGVWMLIINFIERRIVLGI